MRHFQASWSKGSQFKLKKKRGNNSRHLTLRRTAAKDSTNLLRQLNENILRQPQMFCNAKKDTLSIFKMRHLQASWSKRWQFKLKEKLENNSRHLTLRRTAVAAKDSTDFVKQLSENILRQPQMFCNAMKDTPSIFKMRHFQASHSKRWQFKLKEKLKNNSRHLWRFASYPRTRSTKSTKNE